MYTKFPKGHAEQTVNIGSIMSKGIISISPDYSVLEAAKVLRKNRIGAVLVVQEGALKGILSERDIIAKVIALRKDPKSIRASSIMTKKLFTAKPEDSISSVLTQMQRKHVRHIPVVTKDFKPLGIVSIRDMLAKAQSFLKRELQVKDKYLTYDALTGLKNYRFFNDCLDIEIVRSRHNDSPFSLLFMDLDHFKELNDSLGHPAGNLVLMRFGEILTQTRAAGAKNNFALRKSDIAIRFGGDEFSLILPDTNSEGALICAERLLKVTAEELNNLPGINAPLPITVSIGISTFPTNAKNRKALIHNSDQALYEAKKKGKNQICIYHSAMPKRMGTGPVDLANKVLS